MSDRPVLYIEDDENDVLLLRRAFKLAEVRNELRVVADGQELIDFLTRAADSGDRQQYPVPVLLLLDLNLPRVPGLEALRWIRGHRTWHTLPVVIMSSSNQDRDLVTAYTLGANGYLVKPSNPRQLVEITASVRDFWLTHNQIVPESSISGGTGA